MAGFTDAEIAKRLLETTGWQYSGGQIFREFSFESFTGAIEFVRQVSEIAERLDHHPDIDIRYTTVRVAVSSHDVGAITSRDFRLADSVNGLA